MRPLKATVSPTHLKTFSKSRRAIPRITPGFLVAAFSLWAPPSNEAAAQVVPMDSLPADSISPILLPPLTVEILGPLTDLDRAPLSVSVLDRWEMVRGKTGMSLEEALQGIPGVSVQNRYNFALGERLTVRGMGARAQFGIRGLQILVDGIPSTFPDGQSALDHLEVGSLAKAEILRGPASSLYGNGAGGVIRLETMGPSPGRIREEATLTVGGHGLVRGTSTTSGTVGETGYLLDVGSLSWKGFRRDPTNDGRTYGEARRSMVHGKIVRPLGPGTLGLSLRLVALDSENPGSLSRSQMAGRDFPANAFNVIRRTGKDLTQGQIGLQWSGRWGRNEGNLAAFGTFREVWNPIPPSIVDLERWAGGLRGSAGGQISRGGIFFRWMVGGELGIQSDGRLNLENQDGEAGGVTLNQREEVLALGGFVQGVLELPGETTGLLALRYDRAGFEVRDRLKGPDDPDDSGSRVMDAFSPSLGISVPLPGNLRIKASASTFFQTPTTTELANQPEGAGGFNRSLSPQMGHGLEAGVHWKPAEGGQLEITAFRTRMVDELVPFEVPGAPGRVFYRNAGSSSYRGLELAGTAAFPRGFRLRGAYTLLRARFVDYRPEGEDFGGNRIPGIPRTTLEGLVSWEGAAPWGTGRSAAELRGLYRGSVAADDGNTEEARPFALLEARLEMDLPSLGGMGLSTLLGVRNLLDRRYVSSLSVNAFGSRFYDPAPPRSVYFGLRAILGPNPEDAPARKTRPDPIPIAGFRRK